MGRIKREYTTHSETETYDLGYRLGSKLEDNGVVCFFGDLAAGKTTFIKGLTAGAAAFPDSEVSSPTFVYLNIYQGNRKIYHFDLYRLRDADEFLSMGFDEFFTAGGICCIEWSERIPLLLPEGCLKVVMSHAGGENVREIIIEEA